MSTEILIIDDNVDIRNIINDLIIEAGYKTRLAANYNQEKRYWSRFIHC